jgi:hypothetical protein
MAGLVPAIHVFLVEVAVKTWMPGTGPGMTSSMAHSDLLRVGRFLRMKSKAA